MKCGNIKIVIKSLNSYTYFNLAKSKILDVTFKTDIDEQKNYVSIVGGAIGGAALFGTVGLMVGGRAKKRIDRKVNNFLIYAYKKEEKIKNIIFEVPLDIWSQGQNKGINKFISDFKNKPKEEKNMDL